jgi:hypothetical protein
MFDRLAPSSHERDCLAPIFSYYYSNSEAVDVNAWRKRVCCFGEWGTNFDMVVFACLFKINVKKFLKMLDSTQLKDLNSCSNVTDP